MSSQETRPRAYVALTVCGLFAILLVLSACTQTEFPIRLTNITVTPDPVVGQVVTLHVEAVSTKDELDATILVDLPDGVKLVE